MINNIFFTMRKKTAIKKLYNIHNDIDLSERFITLYYIYNSISSFYWCNGLNDILEQIEKLPNNVKIAFELENKLYE